MRAVGEGSGSISAKGGNTHRATADSIAHRAGLSSAKRSALIAAAKARDGKNCWLCEGPFERSGDLRLTLEHLTPRSHGGTYDHENIYLAHEVCNVLLGDMTRREKLRFRRSIRAKARPPILPAWHRSRSATGAA